MEFIAVLALIIGVIAVFAGTFLISIIVRGWVLSWLWLWFIVPLFNLPPIGIAQALGLSIIMQFVTQQLDLSKDEDDEKKKKVKLISVMISPFIVLIIGYVIHLFM